MSLWKWNDVELEIDMEDYDFLHKYEKAFETLEKKESELQKVGTQTVIIKEYCDCLLYTSSDCMNREYKEQLSRQIERNYSDLEMRIMKDIVRRIKKAEKITSTADWQINRLRILGNSSEDIEKMLKEALNASYPQMFELYDKVIDWEYVRNKDIYEQINAEFIPYEENDELQQITNALIQQTDADLRNITQSLGFYLDYGGGKPVLTPLAEVYQKYLDSACLDIVSGAFDYNLSLIHI